MPSGITGLSHVTVIVNDLAAARRFYGELMGLSETPRPPWPAPGVWYQVGAAHLHLAVDVDFQPATHPNYGPGPHFAVNTSTDQYHATIAALRAAGVPFHSAPRQDPSDGHWRAFCKDPSGNVVEVTDHNPLA